jgi:hypothetical protein
VPVAAQWAGQAVRLLRQIPTGELVEPFVTEAQAVVRC